MGDGWESPGRRQAISGISRLLLAGGPKLPAAGNSAGRPCCFSAPRRPVRRLGLFSVPYLAAVPCGPVKVLRKLRLLSIKLPGLVALILDLKNCGKTAFFVWHSVKKTVSFISAVRRVVPGNPFTRLNLGVKTMATSAFANVIGKVFTTDHREGFAKETGAAYSMDIIQVLVPGGGLTELVLPSEPKLTREALASLEGKDVNFLIEIFRNKYGFGTNVKHEVTNTVAQAAAGHKTPQHA